MKFLIWGAIVGAIVYWMLRPRQSRDRTGGQKQATENRLNSESMLRCAQCGVHVPASEAFCTSTGIAYCSRAHQLLHGGN